MVQILLWKCLDEERPREGCRQVRKRCVQCSGVGGILGLETSEGVWEGKWLVLGLLLIFSQLLIP